MHKSQSKNLSNIDLSILFFLSFFIWSFCFRRFLCAELALSSDAIAYYEHFRYFIENISRGIFPMWEPTRQGGVPVEFFLRRIGAFNPLYFFIVLFTTLGVPYTFAYLIFLSLYYFLGMIGFYKLAQCIFNDQKVSFLAFLLLLFSSMATRLFDSYINLTFIPMIWFFYFLIAFVQQFKRVYFLGLTFCFMLLMTTYIPFYFIFIFMSFLACFIVFYMHNFLKIIKKIFQFTMQNKVLTFLCLILMATSLIPGLLYYLDADQQQMVMPMRGAHSESETSLAVSTQRITGWGIIEDIMYSISFSNLKKFKFAILYLPIFIYLVFFLSLFTRITKRSFFLFVWGTGLLLVLMPTATPIYEFLYRELFFFKLFRNLHFYLWLILMPIFILFVAEQFRLFLKMLSQKTWSRHLAFLFMFGVHTAFVYFINIRGSDIITSYVVITLSFMFYCMLFYNKLNFSKMIYGVFLVLLVSLQPIEIYTYLGQNSIDLKSINTYRYRGRKIYLRFNLPDEESLKQRPKVYSQNVDDLMRVKDERPFSMYMGMKWFYALHKALNNKILDTYHRGPLHVYDNVVWMDENNLNFNRVAETFIHYKNFAFVSPNSGKDREIFETELSPPDHKQLFSQVITKDSQEVQLIKFDINYLKLKTNFKRRKFLVYNDNYHKYWRAYLDGEPLKIWRANIAFKGFWIPPGEHTIVLRYGLWWQYVLNYGLLVIFQLVFISLVIASLNNNKASQVVRKDA